ncbi:MAG: hypothetical protein RJA52_358 [Bacteroidota bacterium]
MTTNLPMKFHLKNSFTGLLFFWVLGVFAQEIPQPMSPPRLLNDFHGLISPGAAEEIESQLLAYNDSTSTQIAVVIETTLFDGDDFQRAFAIYDSWKIGTAGKDNGVLLYVAVNDRKIRIITGYGAEGFLPDALARRIIENVIKPPFIEENYDEGILNGVKVIMAAGSGEYTPEMTQEEDPTWIIILITGFVLLIILLSIFLPNGGGGYSGHGRYNDRDGLGGRNSGGWIFSGGGSGGGGGFGGFGGGMSGGGGAGGSW